MDVIKISTFLMRTEICLRVFIFFVYVLRFRFSGIQFFFFTRELSAPFKNDITTHVYDFQFPIFTTIFTYAQHTFPSIPRFETFSRSCDFVCQNMVWAHHFQFRCELLKNTKRYWFSLIRNAFKANKLLRMVSHFTNLIGQQFVRFSFFHFVYFIFMATNSEKNLCRP